MTGPHELVRIEPSVEAPFEPPHPATLYFAQRLQELSQNLNVRNLDGSGRVRKLTPLRLQKLLKEQAPDLPVSQTQIYRYYHGESPPRLDVVYELAALLGVSPREFLPPDTSD
ncbi:helix-turn-helix domain-containing protein [Mycolicibacterium sp. XJ870]